MKSDKCTPKVKFVKLNAYDKDMIPLIVLYSQARLCPTNLSRLATPLPAEQQLYTCRLEEGYDLPAPKYEAWLKIHHPNVNNSMSLSFSQQLSSQLLFSAGEEGLRLQMSCSVSTVHIDIPVTPLAITNSKSAASFSETSTHTSLTLVRQMMHPNPTKLKLTQPTPHNHLKAVPVNPGTPSSGSSRSSLETIK